LNFLLSTLKKIQTFNSHFPLFKRQCHEIFDPRFFFSLNIFTAFTAKFLCTQEEVARLTGELSRARDSLTSLETELERERRKTSSGNSSTLSGSDRSAASLVRKYGELYAQTRLDTLESLDRLAELEGLDDLKSKLLFSVIVVSILLRILMYLTN
jgi:hypothetical protein